MNNQAHPSYIKLVNDNPPLSRAQEHRLFVKAKKGDAKAREKIIHLGMSWSLTISRRITRGQIVPDDLIQEGAAAVLHAYDLFDPYRGTRWSTYVCWWVQAYMRRYLQLQHGSVVRPILRERSRPDVSLDEPVSEEMDVPRRDLLPDERETSEERVGEAEQRMRVRAALAKLKDQLGPVGWDIVHNRLMHNDTLEQIGRRHSLSRERIRQVELRVRALLRAALPAMLEEVEAGAPIPSGRYRYVTHQGETLSLSAWARRLGIGRETLTYRLDKGWNVREAFTTPVKKTGEEAA